MKTTQMNRIAVAWAVAALIGCGGSTTQVNTTNNASTNTASEPQFTCSNNAECRAQTGNENMVCCIDDECTSGSKSYTKGVCYEDLETISRTEEVEALDYVEGVDEKAQDHFRMGVRAALGTPPDYKKAIELFKEAIDVDENFVEPYLNIGKTYEQLRQADKALEAYQRAVTVFPENSDAQALAGKMYLAQAQKLLEQGKKQEAEALMNKGKATFDSVVATDFENVPANNALALFWLLNKDVSKAEEYVKQVLIIEPFNVTALNTRGLIFLERNELRFARWVFEQKVLTLDPNSIEAHTNLGTVLVRQKDLPLAVKHFKDAVKLDPRNVPARLNLGAIFIDFLNYQAAAVEFRKVLEIEPDNVEAVIGEATATLGLGDFDKAILGWERAIKMDSRRVILLKRVGELYEKRSKKADVLKALEYYRRYLASAKLPPTDMTAKKVKALQDAIDMGMFDKPAEQPKTPDDDTDGTSDAETPAPDGEESPTEPPADKDEGTAPAPTPDAAATGDKEAPSEAPSSDKPAEAGEPEPSKETSAPTNAPAEKTEADE
jgi:tetratricopeptide (TPR) repeat protein